VHEGGEDTSRQGAIPIDGERYGPRPHGGSQCVCRLGSTEKRKTARRERGKKTIQTVEGGRRRKSGSVRSNKTRKEKDLGHYPDLRRARKAR